MTSEPVPDGEAVISAYLRESDALTDLLGDADRIGPEHPADKSEPWIKFAQIDIAPNPTSSALWTVTVQLQFDCYGSDSRGTGVAKQEASELVRTLQAVLHDANEAEHEGAVVTSTRFGACPYVPDPDIEPARARYIQDAFITLHAAP